MRKWGRLARAIPTAESVPNASNVPNVAGSPSFGTFGTFGTAIAERASDTFGTFDTFGTRPLWDDEDRQAAFDERAGILEYDGGFTREEAERLAAAEIAVLYPVLH